ncbi:hypothetical protein EDD63_1301 [Breznakia blatticola]|uniref:Cof subfamily protein (Haloacid dehalogenase superfamily)/HAD superfamily hydrolase (TIGR01484 family) n=1 Tax=Breznakia blatticola TaxID=1754012 RepID=A0A4R7ZF26_9FIRM|nr:HAD family hydrolase [Breznakia blatticola]TDW14808.1 hypothetical protein EDD63_1301 [Breznakia blatticola]
MKKKYMFFDLDGTLTTGVKHGNEIPKLTLDTIQALKEQGHFLSLATGRPHYHAKEMAKQLGIHHIVSNGGYCAQVDDEMIFHEGMNQEEVQALLNTCKEYQIPIAVSKDGDDQFVTNSLALKQTIDSFNFWGKVTIDPYFDPNSYEKITRMIVDESYRKYEHLHAFKDIILVGYYSPFMIVEPDDKYGGIQKMMKYLDAPLEDVVCFGDGHNDISMISQAATGIAMGNAVDELKAVATYVTTNCDEDGILHACKHFGWL